MQVSDILNRKLLCLIAYVLPDYSIHYSSHYTSCGWIDSYRKKPRPWKIKFYPIRYDLHSNFTKPKAEWNLQANQIEWEITCIFHGRGFFLSYHRCFFTHLWNTQVMSYNLIFHQKWNIRDMIKWSGISATSGGTSDELLDRELE